MIFLAAFLASLFTVVMLAVAYLTVVDAIAHYKRPRGIPLWPDLRRTKDLKRWS